MKKGKSNILNRYGMTPPELLMTVIIIGGLAFIVAVLVDRSYAIRKARDIARFNHTQVILSSILRYEIDTQGRVPSGIDDDESTWQAIAMPGEPCIAACENKTVVDKCADLSILVPKYVERIPQDELFTGLGVSGYYINKQAERNIVTVGACITERVPVIEIRQ